MFVRGRILSLVLDIAIIDGKNLREKSRLYKLSKFLLRKQMLMRINTKKVLKKLTNNVWITKYVHRRILQKLFDHSNRIRLQFLYVSIKRRLLDLEK